MAARDALIEKLCALPPIATALDAIIEHFGTEAVAEVTGRTRRLVLGRDGQQRLERRSPSANVAEAQSFMEGTKRILVFSDAGGTGDPTMPTSAVVISNAGSISCSSRAGAPTTPSRVLVGPTAPIRPRPRCSARSPQM
jgi:hypothetical protein